MRKLGVEEWLVSAVIYTGAKTVVKTDYANNKYFEVPREVVQQLCAMQYVTSK